MRWRSAAVVPATVFALAAGMLPAASPASAASTVSTSTVSISASKVFETDTGDTRTAAMPGGGYLAVHSFGTLSMVGADGRTLWQRGTASLYRDWRVRWQNPAAYVNAPEVPWGTNPVNPLQFAGGVAGLVNDVTPYAVGELGGSRSPDVAVAEVVGTSLLGESSCEFCAWPFNVPGSSVHLGTFVSVLDGRTGRMLFHEVEPGYVTQLAIAGGRLIVGDETGDPLRQGGIGAWGSASNVSALSFTPSGGSLAAHRSWRYSTGAPWSRILAMTPAGNGLAVAWSDTPFGLGVPAPPHGHVLLFDARSGRQRWHIRTGGYPVLLAPDAARGELVTVQLSDPLQSVGYSVTGLRARNGATEVTAHRAGALPLALAAGRPGWAVAAVDATVPAGVLEYQPTGGRVTLTSPATGRDRWSVQLPSRGPNGVPRPGGLVMAHGSIFVGSWVGDPLYPTSAQPEVQVDAMSALSASDGSLRWQQTGDTGNPLSMSPAGAGVRAVTSNQVVRSYQPDGTASAGTAAGPGDELSAVVAGVASASSTDLVTGDQDGEVSAFAGPSLTSGHPRLLWQTMLPGAVHQIRRGQLDGRSVLVAAASSAVAVLDTRTGRLLTLIKVPGYAWTVTLAAAGRTPVAVVPGTSLTAYSLARGTVVWRDRAPSGAFFSNAAVADGIVAAEYSSAERPGDAAASHLAAVGVSAATGAMKWSHKPGRAVLRGQLWNGVIASPDIAGSGGHGVAFTWQTSGSGRVDVRDIRTGALLYSVTADDLDSHTAFLAVPRIGLVAVSQLGSVVIKPGSGAESTLLSGMSMAVASTASGSSALLVAYNGVTAYGTSALTDSSAAPLASDNTYSAGMLVAGDFAGNGRSQVVTLPVDSIAYRVVGNESGANPYGYQDTQPHGVAVLALTGTGAAAGPARAPRHPAITATTGTPGLAGATGLASPEPVRSGISQPVAGPARHAAGSSAPPGYAPALIRSYLGLSGQGSGQTIAIVDAYGDPKIAADAQKFSQQFGLPGVCGAGGKAGDCFTLDVARPEGAAGPNGDWDLETSLDVEWAHAIAPRARIMLVESSDASFGAMFRAVKVAAAAHPAAVSLSWGAGEFSDETSYDRYCAVSGSVCVAASGDNGHPGIYPAASRYAIAVGGTSLTLTSGGSVTSEVAWSGSGGGRSWFEQIPPSQRQVVSGDRREFPDVSYDADPATGVAVYDSVPYQGETGWWQVGGTSLGAPSWSAILADADQLRAAAGAAPLTAAGFGAQRALYGLSSAEIADITAGPANGFCPVGCLAGPGYDQVTGIGSPRAGIDAALAAAGSRH